MGRPLVVTRIKGIERTAIDTRHSCCFVEVQLPPYVYRFPVRLVGDLGQRYTVLFRFGDYLADCEKARNVTSSFSQQIQGQKLI